MPTFADGPAFTHTILPDNFKQASYKPTAEEAAKAKALINFMMQDRLFLALYRSLAADIATIKDGEGLARVAKDLKAIEKEILGLLAEGKGEECANVIIADPANRSRLSTPPGQRC